MKASRSPGVSYKRSVSLHQRLGRYFSPPPVLANQLPAVRSSSSITLLILTYLALCTVARMTEPHKFVLLIQNYGYVGVRSSLKKLFEGEDAQYKVRITVVASISC